MFNGGILIVDATGRFLADSTFPTERPAALLAQNDAIATTYGEGASAISRPLPGRTPKAAKPTTISTPIFSEHNEILGALVGITDIERASFLDPIARNRYGKTGLYLLVSQAID